MFGYVLPQLQELPDAEQMRFRRVYCGLCRCLKARGGLAASMILNYDFTFLAMLLMQEEPGFSRAACIAHPFAGREFFQDSEALEKAADESLILAWYQLQDTLDDEYGAKRLRARAELAALRPAYERARAAEPVFCRLVKERLAALSELEKTGSAEMDAAADCFAGLLRSAVPEREDARSRVLRQILYHLGRWIYLVDAADDLKRDALSGSYNPVALRYGLSGGCWTDEARRDFAATLDLSIHRITTAFELADFGAFTGILRETFYRGLFAVGRSVLDGTFRKAGQPPKTLQTGGNRT